jgi:hypothetical protein
LSGRVSDVNLSGRLKEAVEVICSLSVVAYKTRVENFADVEKVFRSLSSI